MKKCRILTPEFERRLRVMRELGNGRNNSCTELSRHLTLSYVYVNTLINGWNKLGYLSSEPEQHGNLRKIILTEKGKSLWKKLSFIQKKFQEIKLEINDETLDLGDYLAKEMI